MISNSDLQKWQQAINGINESGQTVLTKEEWVALQALNSSLSSGNFQSDENRSSINLLKNNLSRYANNPVLQVHLQNFINLYEKYFNIEAVSTPIPALNLSNQQVNVNTRGNPPKDSRKGSDSIRTVIVIAVILLAGYATVKNSEWVDSLFSGETNDNCTLEVHIPNGNRYSGYIDSVYFINYKDKIYYNDGNFTLKMNDLPENWLKELEPIANMSDSWFSFKGAIISDANTQCYYNFGTSFIYTCNNNGNEQGLIYLANQDMKGRDRSDFRWMIPLYVDRKCKISGSNSYMDGIFTYNLSLKKGWNKMYLCQREKNVALTTTPPSGLEWRVWWSD